MAQLTDKPFPPGRYPLIVVGSGPGGLQLSYALSRLGIRYAVLSSDPAPGGMFRRWPIFQRMLSWTKPFTPFDHRSREYERFDWNSLIADEDALRGTMPGIMDGTSYFPSRPEMQRGLETFATNAAIQVRYECRWESTARRGDELVLLTSDGEFRAPIVVFAVGVAEPWWAPVRGLSEVPHYANFPAVETYRDHRVFIVGKQNSGFEIATGLLPWARQIVLASPGPTRLSVTTHSLVGVRARYLQPYEDHVLAGGVLVMDATIEDVARRNDGYRVRTISAHDGAEVSLDVDDVIAATGFTAPLRDLPQLGVKTFGQSRIPAQTPFWESTTVPGIFFAGTLSQGAGGLKKHGIPSNSGAVQGHRYNAWVLARHLAETRFHLAPSRPHLDPDSVVPCLLAEATRGPELWHQRAYLCRVVTIGSGAGIVDEGIVPLAHFVDAGGPDAVAMTLESNGKDDIYPVAYIRRAGAVTEHPLPPNPVHQFEGAEYVAPLRGALEPILSPSLTRR